MDRAIRFDDGRGTDSFRRIERRSRRSGNGDWGFVGGRVTSRRSCVGSTQPATDADGPRLFADDYERIRHDGRRCDARHVGSSDGRTAERASIISHLGLGRSFGTSRDDGDDISVELGTRSRTRVPSRRIRQSRARRRSDTGRDAAPRYSGALRANRWIAGCRRRDIRGGWRHRCRPAGQTERSCRCSISKRVTREVISGMSARPLGPRSTP